MLGNSTKVKGVGNPPDHSDSPWVIREEGKSVGDRFPDHPCWSEEPSQEHLPAASLDGIRDSWFSRYRITTSRTSEPGVCEGYFWNKLIT